MPNTREKLIELLKLSDACICTLCGEKGSLNRVAGVIADNLIAGGVTVQKWIPVTERLPEDGGDYLVVVKFKFDWEKQYNYGTDVATFSLEMGDIDDCWYTYNDWYEGQEHMHITHWMPLPQPPKGE